MMRRIASKLSVVAASMLGHLSALILGAMATIIFLQVIYRYVFESPLAWSEELARFLFVWITFIGGALAAIRGGHIAMSVLVDILPIRLAAWIRGLGHLLTALFFGVVTFLLLTMMPTLMRQTSPALQLPMGYPYLGILIGSGLMFVFYVAGAIDALRGTASSDPHDKQAEEGRR